MLLYTHNKTLSKKVPPNLFIIHIPGSVLNIVLSQDMATYPNCAVLAGPAILKSKLVNNAREYATAKINKIIKKMLKKYFQFIAARLFFITMPESATSNPKNKINIRVITGMPMGELALMSKEFSKNAPTPKAFIEGF